MPLFSPRCYGFQTLFCFPSVSKLCSSKDTGFSIRDYCQDSDSQRCKISFRIVISTIFDWMRLDSILKKSRPQYIPAPKISTLFWWTGWAWNWQIIFRFASIHGRACFILYFTYNDPKRYFASLTVAVLKSQKLISTQKKKFVSMSEEI
jgi:hypothetical protein